MKKSSDSGASRGSLEWRPMRATRVGWTIVGIIGVIVPWSLDPGSEIAASIVISLGGLFVVWCAWRPKVQIRGDKVVVRGPFRTVSVSKSDVIGVVPGYRGGSLIQAKNRCVYSYVELPMGVSSDGRETFESAVLSGHD